MNTNLPSNGNNNPFEIFNYKNLGSVRVQLDQNGNPWFCLNDICDVLKLSNSRMLASRLNQKGVSLSYTLTNGGTQEMTFIDEGNLYMAIGRSRKPEAQGFIDWVFREVVPAIRKTGMYMTDDVFDYVNKNPENLANLLENYAKAVRENGRLKEENTNLLDSFNEEREVANNYQRESEDLEDELYYSEQYIEYLENTLNTYASDCINTYSMGDFAKMSNFVDNNGELIGRNRLLEILRKEKYLMSGVYNKNKPYQKYISNGYFKAFVKKSNIGNIVIIRITEKGKNNILKELQFKGYVINNY